MNMMSEPNRPATATLLWDGDCGFCKSWIERWRKTTGGAVEYRPYQEALAEFPQVSEAACQRAVQLIAPDGQVYSGAHAVFRALAAAGRCRRVLALYEGAPPFRWLADAAYRFVAANRNWLPQ